MADEISRGSLPIPDRAHTGLVTYDAKDPDTAFPPIEPVRPPEGAPNVLVVLIDDCGFGASSAFGGPCSTPTAERLAENGAGSGDAAKNYQASPRPREPSAGYNARAGAQIVRNEIGRAVAAD